MKHFPPASVKYVHVDYCMVHADIKTNFLVIKVFQQKESAKTIFIKLSDSHRVYKDLLS